MTKWLFLGVLFFILLTTTGYLLKSNGALKAQLSQVSSVNKTLESALENHQRYRQYEIEVDKNLSLQLSKSQREYDKNSEAMENEFINNKESWNWGNARIPTNVLKQLRNDNDKLQTQ